MSIKYKDFLKLNKLDENLDKHNKPVKTDLKSIRSKLNSYSEATQDPDIKDRAGTQPKKYYSGLSKSTKTDRDAHFKKNSKKADDDNSAYKPAPGDADAETKPSKHTKKYKQMFGEDAKTGLAKKAEKSGMPIGILRQVYNRGVAAWKTGHRPGTTPQQWGYARVNSFITKSSGTWGKADKDLASKVRSEEFQLEATEIDEVLSMQQRRQKARKMRVMSKKMAIGRKRALKRAASPEKLKQRAEKAARATVFKKLSKGKSKDQVPLMKRIEIEKRMAKMGSRIKRLSVKLLPTVRTIDRERRKNKT